MVTIPKNDHYIVKLGGSLMDRAPEITATLAGSKKNITVVPGGGEFADRIRNMDLDDDTSHWMAVLAMEQYGFYLSSLGLPEKFEPKKTPGVSVLLPYSWIRKTDPLPHSWDVTSDTISAWVAHETGCPLIILKSTNGLSKDGNHIAIVSEPADYPECDPCLVPYVLENGIEAAVINGRDPLSPGIFFGGGEVPGTIITRSV